MPKTRQATLSNGYCIDTCSLIDLRRRIYPPDVFSSLWHDIEQLVHASLLIAPIEVYDELNSIDEDGEVLWWANKNKRLFVRLSHNQYSNVLSILSDFPNLIDSSNEGKEADPFLISLAKDKRWTIVTSEKPNNDILHPKIPDVCKKISIKCIGNLEFIRENGWKY
jgi:hypothetical protein